MNAKKIPLAILGSAAGFFTVTFTIYFFNLDMKFLSRFVEPITTRSPASTTFKRSPEPGAPPLRRAHFKRYRGDICAVR